MRIEVGGCHCGRVGFSVAGEPRFVSRCHCESCRRTTGAAFSTWAGFSDDKVTWTGDAPEIYASSFGVRRGFCRNCGTSLSFSGDRWPGETHFLIGTFRDPHAFSPASDFMSEEALPWVMDWRPVQ